MSTSISLNQRPNYIFPLVVIGSLFFIFGFVTWANGSLIPFLQIACELTQAQSFYVTSAFFASYFIMALPASYILKKLGFKNGMSLGLFIMAIGALLFIPAANSRSYPLFLIGLYVIATGLTLLQTASNPYVTVLGPIESAAKRISIMGVCNKIAGILAILILGGIILKNADAFKAKLATLTGAAKEAELDALASRIVGPYIIIAIAFAVLAVIIYFIKLPEVKDEEQDAKDHVPTNKKNILQFPHLVLGAIAIFFYVGVEVISYDTFANFGVSIGYTLDEAKTFATFTGYALIAGYLLGIFLIPKYISQRKALIISVILSMLLVVIAILNKGMIAVVCFALLGFSNAIMWPAIWPLAIQGLGRFTKIGAALLIMGIVGGAILPPLYGKLTEATGSNQTAYLMMIPCYLYILYYALAGYKAGKK
ncbi:MAG: sugar MFS transporter [Chitinophagaceae bacterium]|nr:sugar MFS transporter [Chitinophagaceae bacterium]